MSLIITSVDATGLPIACPVSSLADQHDVIQAVQAADEAAYWASSDRDKLDAMKEGSSYLREAHRQYKHLEVLVDRASAETATSERGIAWLMVAMEDVLEGLRSNSYSEGERQDYFELLGRLVNALRRSIGGGVLLN